MSLLERSIFGKTRHIHFTGIGGSGMSGIAEVILTLGFKVTGSDIADSETVSRLRELGAKVYIGHKALNVEGADVLVYSSAISVSNPEVKYAKQIEIPVIPRAEMLAELMRIKRGIAIAGAHGKTTTTSLVGSIFESAKLNPTVVIGGKLFNIKSNAKLGKGEFLICEADESDASLLKLSPEFVIVTNIDNDHLDHYGTFDRLKDTFVEFINKVPFYGFAVVCGDNNNLVSILKRVYKKVIIYGTKKGYDYIARDVKYLSDGTTFKVYKKDEELGEIKIRLWGKHNVLNALASFALSYELGISYNQIKKGLNEFQGVERRLEKKGEVDGISVYDDYGHHPTEIKATLSSIKKGMGKLIVIFQPHRYSRTKLLYKDFKDAFVDADNLFITDIYPAGEKPIKGVSAKLIYNSVKKSSLKNVRYIPKKEDAVEKVIKIAKKGDIILTLGAGDIKNIAPIIIERLKKR